MSLIDEAISNLKNIRAQQGDKKQRNLQRYIREKKKIMSQLDAPQDLQQDESSPKLPKRKLRN